MKQPHGSERRVHPRYDYCARCSLTIAEQLKIIGKVANISRGGVYVALDYHCPESFHSMPMQLIFSADEDSEPIVIEAECRVARADNGGLGLVFSKLNSNAINRLIDLIEDA